MNNKNRVKGANVLPLNVGREEDWSEPSEVARNLFSETWRIYLDEIPMKSVLIKNASGADFKGDDKNLKIDQSEQPLRLYFKD